MTTVTLDTNIFPVADILEKSRGRDIEYKIVTVTERELENTDITIQLSSISETAIYGESRYGQAVYGSKFVPMLEPFVVNESLLNQGIIVSGKDIDVLESLLNVISNKTFPPKRQRQVLSPGHKRQLRDAMILMTHIREKRDVFVTNDVKGFIGEGGEKRKLLESTFQFKIRTRTELEEEYLN